MKMLLGLLKPQNTMLNDLIKFYECEGYLPQDARFLAQKEIEKQSKCVTLLG